GSMVTDVAFCTLHARPIGVFPFCVTVPGTAVKLLMSGSLGAEPQTISNGELVHVIRHWPGGDLGSALPGHVPLESFPTSDCAVTVTRVIFPAACRLMSSGTVKLPIHDGLPGADGWI